MPGTHDISCPVCRARQKQQPACRRCSADLRLVIKTRRSIETAQRHYFQARQVGEHELAARHLRYLMWLKPDAGLLSGDNPDR